MKRREFYEISDDEWENHTFKPSRVLKSPRPPPPPIESFAFRNSSDTSDDCLDITEPVRDGNGGLNCENLEDEEVGVGRESKRVNRRSFVDVSDTDDDCFDITEAVRNGNCENLEDEEVGIGEKSRPVNRRRFVVEDDDDEEEEEEGVVKLESSEEEGAFEEAEEVEEDDLVGRTLQKCAKISLDLKRELYGSSGTACDRYAEVEASSVRIVTQDDVNAACGEEESDFQPILKPYQLVGVNFLLLLYQKSIGGAILADEMGLGKTVQAVTYLTLLKHLNDDPGPHLIVCPASLLENWQRELKKWCPSFCVLLYHGANRSAYSKELSSISKTGMPPPFNVLLVCYSIFERHSAQQKDDRKILRRWQWSCVLMDEAHALKDRSSYRWKNLMSVSRNANQRLMLTGTPLQNDLHELWSLLELMMPDLFATEDVDIKKLLNAEDKELIGRMKSILGPFILRRLKSDVMQQLVPKIQKVEYVSMGKQQENAYKEAIEDYRAVIQARMTKSSDTSSSNVFSLIPKRQISNYFVQFRKIANHPLLVRRIYSDEDIVRFARKLHPIGAFGFECTFDRVVEELKSYSDFAIHRLLLHYDVSDTKGFLSDDYVMFSAKCEALAKLLPKLKRGGHRVLIFSQWTSMLDILEWTLDVIGVSYRRLDGSTQVTDRQTIVDTFNNDTSIFACLLSTRAGGQGLNLTGADTVVIHDMDFNPQIDRQAEDRCHRIGQTKPVTVYRLVTKGTVDENVYEIAKRKLYLDAAVLESGVEVDNEGELGERTMGEILSALLLG